MKNQFKKGELVAVRDHDNQAWMLGEFRAEVDGEFYVKVKGWEASYYLPQCKKLSDFETTQHTIPEFSKKEWVDLYSEFIEGL